MTGAALTTLRGRPPRPVDGTRTSTGFWILNKSVAFLRVESFRAVPVTGPEFTVFCKMLKLHQCTL